MPRKAQTSSASGWLAVPQKILNLSSTRARCGLRSCFSSALIFFSAVAARVGMVFLSQADFVVGRGFETSDDHGSRGRSGDMFLAGPLGFEPRQSAPKALDLPLVDGPVKLVASSP